ncbi:hypothetical protein ACWM35_16100 [Neobacillus sp. K501]
MGKMYVIRIDKENNILYVKVSGTFNEEDALGYMSEFQTAVNTIDPPRYTLIVDGNGQEAVDHHLLGDLKFVLRLYSAANFKKIVIINPTSFESKVQVDACVKEINFKGTFVNTLEEAYSFIHAI